MRTLLCLFILSAFLSGCRRTKMGYAERDSEVNLLDARDSSYIYMADVDEDTYPDSLVVKWNAYRDTLSGIPVRFTCAVFSCDSNGNSAQPLTFSSSVIQIHTTYLYSCFDSIIDLRQLPDSEKTVWEQLPDSTWNEGFDLTFTFALPDSIPPQFLNIHFTSTVRIGDKEFEKQFDYFMIYKSVYDPGSGNPGGKWFCERRRRSFLPSLT